MQQKMAKRKLLIKQMANQNSKENGILDTGFNIFLAKFTEDNPVFEVRNPEDYF